MMAEEINWKDVWNRLKIGYIELSPIIVGELKDLEWEKVPKTWQEDFKKRIKAFYEVV